MPNSGIVVINTVYDGHSESVGQPVPQFTVGDDLLGGGEEWYTYICK